MYFNLPFPDEESGEDSIAIGKECLNKKGNLITNAFQILCM